jgi:hypothetical protein
VVGLGIALAGSPFAPYLSIPAFQLFLSAANVGLGLMDVGLGGVLVSEGRSEKKIANRMASLRRSKVS